jgi:hypothetical protein
MLPMSQYVNKLHCSNKFFKNAGTSTAIKHNKSSRREPCLKNRSRKVAHDPIAQFNKYGILGDEDDLEYEVTRAESASPNARKKSPQTNLIRSSLVQWNCRGLRADFNELLIILQNKNPVAIALQELAISDS